MKSILIGVGTATIAIWAVWILTKLIEIGNTLYEIRDLMKEKEVILWQS
jgi:hypothetical protein